MVDDLYERDFYLWTQAQAQALRVPAGGSNALDYANLAEEVEDLGRSERSKAESVVRQVIARRYKLAASVRKAVACPIVALLLAGCHDNLSAATSADANTCYSLPASTAGKAAGPVKKVVLGLDDDNLETCAMHLEGYRLEHGLPTASGLYEDHVVFASPQGITASTGTGNIRYSVYTRIQQADLDGKLRTLIAQAKAGGTATGGH